MTSNRMRWQHAIFAQIKVQMHIIPQLFRVDKIYTAVQETFNNNKRKWEIIESKNETAIIQDGSYTMKNKSDFNWHYYKARSPLKLKEDFLLETDIELISKDQFGHFGLVWGFDKTPHTMNKFTVSADGERSLMMSFEKDHKQVFYRNQCRGLTTLKSSPFLKISIIKMNEFYFFCINNELLNIVNASHFIINGPYMGFYLEPGIAIKSKRLEIKKLTSRKVKSVSWLEMLLG